jgi:acyl carrier protein
MTSKDTIESRIRGFLTRNFGYRGARADLDGHADLLAQGILDSTGVLEVVAFLEKDLGLTVQDDELVPEHFGTIDRLVAFVDAKQCDTG